MGSTAEGKAEVGMEVEGPEAVARAMAGAMEAATEAAVERRW